MLTEDEIADAREQFLQECRPGGKYSLNFKAPCLTCKWAMCNAGNFADSKAKEEHEDKCVHHPSFCEFCREVQEDPQHVSSCPDNPHSCPNCLKQFAGAKGLNGHKKSCPKKKDPKQGKKSKKRKKVVLTPETSYNSITVKQLKKLCSNHGLPQQGCKNDLVQRLIDNDKKGNRPAHGDTQDHKRFDKHAKQGVAAAAAVPNRHQPAEADTSDSGWRQIALAQFSRAQSQADNTISALLKCVIENTPACLQNPRTSSVPVATPRPSDVCGRANCQNPATSRCGECKLLYCSDCSARLHRIGNLQEHIVASLDVCADCEAKIASVRCTQCRVSYCETCSRSIHNSGTLMEHSISTIQHGF